MIYFLVYHNLKELNQFISNKRDFSADFGGGGDSMFGGNLRRNGHGHMHSSHSSQKCRTVTQKVGNTVTTFTQCS